MAISQRVQLQASERAASKLAMLITRRNYTSQRIASKDEETLSSRAQNFYTRLRLMCRITPLILA